MPSRNHLHLSLSDEHLDLLHSLEKNHRLKPSEFIRLAIDHIIDTNTDLELWAFRERLKRIEKDQAQVQVRIKELEAARPVTASPDEGFQLPAPTLAPQQKKHAVFTNPTGPDRLEGQLEREHTQFLRLNESLAKGEILGERALVKLKTQASNHPDWLSELEPERQRLLLGGIAT